MLRKTRIGARMGAHVGDATLFEAHQQGVKLRIVAFPECDARTVKNGAITLLAFLQRRIDGQHCQPGSLRFQKQHGGDGKCRKGDDQPKRRLEIRILRVGRCIGQKGKNGAGAGDRDQSRPAYSLRGQKDRDDIKHRDRAFYVGIGIDVKYRGRQRQRPKAKSQMVRPAFRFARAKHP